VWRPGARVIAFLDESVPLTGIQGVSKARQVWSIQGGKVGTEFNGDVPLADVIAEIQAAP
jgi:hypothetical protein